MAVVTPKIDTTTVVNDNDVSKDERQIGYVDKQKIIVQMAVAGLAWPMVFEVLSRWTGIYSGYASVTGLAVAILFPSIYFWFWRPNHGQAYQMRRRYVIGCILAIVLTFVYYRIAAEFL